LRDLREDLQRGLTAARTGFLTREPSSYEDVVAA